MKYLDTLLEKYQIRKTKEQKTAFLSWAQEEIKNMGYECRVEEYEKDMFKCRNLIVGNPDEAKVIYTAHYDTQPVLPLPNMVFPKNGLFTIGAQLPVMLFMFVLCFVGIFAVNRLVPDDTLLSFILTEGWIILSVGIYLGLLFFGPANKHTANDNTSGTACLMEMMAQLPEEHRKHAAFIFFDQEERGKIGSLEFAKKHPEIKENSFIMNLDCIGDGNHMMIVAPKKTPDDVLTNLEKLFPGNDTFVTEAITAKHASYNSDQRSFKQGYAIAALHLHPTFGLHLKRIHTKRDTICEKANLQFVIDGCLNLLKQKAEEN